MAGFGWINWRWQIQDAEWEGKRAFEAGRGRETCRYKRRDLVDAWNEAYSRAERESRGT